MTPRLACWRFAAFLFFGTLFPGTLFPGTLFPGTLWPAIASAADLSPEDAERLASTAKMRERVEQLLAERWAKESFEPAPMADDAEFLRRSYFDLCGTLPTVPDVRSFLSDGSPDKRAQLVDKLLEHPDHATHLADTWRNFLLPGDLEPERLGGTLGFQSWLRQQFAKNQRYDNLVADLLVATGNANQTGAALFYTALQSKPEEVASATSRIFLGVQIQCAQCHNHPYDSWKQDDFWGYAAFFARVQQQPIRRMANRLQVVDAASGEVKLPDTDKVVHPKYLDAQAAADGQDSSRRRQLAIWLVSRENPYFAKATVNRIWGQMFGRGIVDPVDDMSPRNPPSHPELLNELAAWFVDSGYDVKELYRLIANSRAYQLTSQASAAAADERPELFARMPIKNLTAEQLYDGLAKATLRRPPAAMAEAEQAAGRQNDPDRQAFLTKFRSANPKSTEFQSGIPQALTLMNGQSITIATDLKQSALLESLAAPFFSDDDRLEVLFLATLSRPPRDDERGQFVCYLAEEGKENQRMRGLSNALWALLNSAEFALNH